jgi:RNA-binding protein NOB1
MDSWSAPKRDDSFVVFSYMSSTSPCRNLILDAGPLLSLSPLRGLAETYLTVPQVLDELKDRKAREHFEQLGLSAGVHVEVRSPDAASLAKGEIDGHI